MIQSLKELVSIKFREVFFMNQQMLERVQGLLHSACQEKEIAGASFLFRDKNGDETFCAEGWADI